MKNILNFLCAAVLFVGLFVHAAPAQATDMASGTTVTGTVPQSTPGFPTYTTQTFTGTAGQAISLYINSSISTYLAVDKPDGTNWFHNNGVRFSGNLPATGTYTVKISAVQNYQSAGYSLAYLRGGSTVSNGSLTSGANRRAIGIDRALPLQHAFGFSVHCTLSRPRGIGRARRL